LVAPLPEKNLQQLGATARQHSCANLHVMIQRGVVQYFDHRMDCAGFEVVGAVHQTPNPRVYQGSGAHRARLNCSKQLAVAKAMVSDGCASLAKRNNLGVGGGVTVREIAVPPVRDNAALANHNCSDRHLAGFQRALGGAECFLHEKFVSIQGTIQ
jgi:hypothetical protein